MWHGIGGEGKGTPLPLGMSPHPVCPISTHPWVSPTPGCWALGCQPLPSTVQSPVKPFLAQFGMGGGVSK